MATRHMQMLILIAFMNLVESQSTKGGYCQAREAACILEAFGYSPSCVLNALSTCEEKRLYSSIEAELKKMTEVLSTLALDQPGSTQTLNPRNCFELRKRGDRASGVKTIYPYDSMPSKPVKVYCEQDIDGGGWTMFVRRDNLPIRENYNRTWIEYALGFGHRDMEFWLGLDNIHALTNSELVELRVDVEDWEQKKRFAKYSFFHVGNSLEKYILHVSGYSGDAGDSFISEYEQYNHYGMKFTTLDSDNDNHTENCAGGPLGGWWYNRCHISSFNGLPMIGEEATHGQGITWHTFRGTFYSLKRATMMLRPAFK